MKTFHACRHSALYLALLSTPAWAEDEQALTLNQGEPIITSEVFHKLTVQSGYGPEDSTVGNDRESFHSIRYEPSFHWYSPEKRWAKWHLYGRAWINYDTSQASTPLQENNVQQTEDRERPEYFYSELRELYVQRNLLGDDPRFSMKLGRQSFFDYYGIWWDDSIEALRFDYQDSFSSGFFAIAQKFYYYNTDVNSLDDTEEDIFYAMGEYAWRWSERNWVGVRMVYEDDSSDTDPRDAQDFTGIRAGMFFKGQNLNLGPISDYHLELASLDGDIDSVDSNGVRSSGSTRGWAVLGEVGKRFHDVRWTPRIALRAGITDEPDDDNDGFYLNRIQSDRLVDPERYSTRLVSSFINLNIRNLKYYGVALETHPTPRSSIDIRLSDLYLRNDEGNLPLRVDREQNRQRNQAIANGTFNGSNSLGQVLDLNYYWKMFPVAYDGKHIDINTLLSASYFRAGSAIESGDDYQVTVGVVLRY